MAQLEKNEIAAALDTARYIIKSHQEVDRLLIDEEKREIYLLKLAIDLEVALAYEEKCWKISHEADAEEQMARDALAEKRRFYN